MLERRYYNRIRSVPERLKTAELGRPDTIAHRRGPDGPNLLALELKGKETDENVLLEELGKLRNHSSGPDLSYHLMALIHFGGGAFCVGDFHQCYADGHL